MNLLDLLTSPPPPTGWSLDPALAAVVRRQGQAELRSAAMELPDDVFEIGPVGLQAVDGELLRPVLERLHAEVEGSKRVSVILPTGWLRIHLLEFDKLPRRQNEIHDLVSWRLKKLLPVPPSSLRVALVPQPAGEEGRKLLVLTGVERAMAELEGVFSSIGVSPGIITPRVFAAAAGWDASSPLMIVQQELGFLAFMLLVDNRPVVIRTKPLPRDDWAVVERELGLTMSFLAANLGITDGVAVAVSTESETLAERLRTWIEVSDGLTTAVQPVPHGGFLGTTVRDRAGAFRLDPAVGVVSGGLR
jgi:hypothetical protein